MVPGATKVHLSLLLVVILVGHVTSQVLVWDKKCDQVRVSEDAKEGTVMPCFFKAVVRGEVNTNSIIYTLDSTSFGIGRTDGKLILRAPLDREEHATLKLKIQADTTTNAGTSISVAHEMYVYVTDVNDNAPQFRRKGVVGEYKDYKTSLKENTKVGTKFFVDEMWGFDRDDSAVHSLLKFSCDADGDQSKSTTSREEAKKACETFGVETHQLPSKGSYSARFFLKKPLNFKQKRQYIMTVLLQDFYADGTVAHSVNGLLIIKVKDTQNEPPIFKPEIVYATVDDGKPANSYITLVMAQDQDMEAAIDKNPVRISLVTDANGKFKLIEQNCTTNQQYPEDYCGFIFNTVPIDREQDSTYQLKVLGKEVDKATGKFNGFTATATVIVNVLDKNDNGPVITPATKTIDVNEGRTDAILTLRIQDKDTPANGKFNLTLIQPFDAFQLAPQNPHQTLTVAQISVKNPNMINYEMPQYRKQVIKVVAKGFDPADKGTHHSSTGTYTINILDENDNAPKFDKKNYSASVKENSAVGTSIITITAKDADSAKFGPITYKIEGDSQQSGVRVKIDTSTGKITVAGDIDYEKEKQFNVFVVASDSGKKEDTVKLEINVIDQNDVKPVFETELYRTKVKEKNTTLIPAVTVKATDKETKSLTLTYNIIGGNTKDKAFSVDRKTGVLSLSRALNYAEAPAGSGGVFSLIIQANDGGSPPGKSTATVRVQVLDVNDFPPEFKQTTYRAQVDETAKPEKNVVQVSAKDQDGGSNGQFIYRIASGSGDQFSIKQDGWIAVAIKSSLDYDVAKQYTMKVLATDKGSPQKTGTCTVIIDIKDKNNKGPIFKPNSFYKSISADAKSGETIENVKAIDTDTTAKLSYRIPWTSYRVTDVNSRLITGSQIVDQIAVESQTGRVYLRRDLRPDAAVSVSFFVIAEDMNAEPKGTQTATATVIVSIFKDEGDTPLFNSPWTPQNPVFNLFIPEEQPINSLVVALTARDPKTKQWLDNFKKVPNSDPQGYFKVYEKSGEVRLAKRVDYEQLNPKVIRCKVVVSTPDKRTSTALVIVNIQDMNDNSPTFARSEFTFSVSESAPFRTSVGNVRATDPDSGSFGQISYTLTGQRALDFAIDQGNGDLLVAGRLDREVYPRYQLLVNAVDNPKASGSRKSGIATVIINVQDVNDNAPVFEQRQYKMYVMETAPKHTSLGKILATDKDEGENSKIRYAITSGNPNGWFAIDRFRGIFRTAASIKGHARGAPYEVLVEAVDNGSPSSQRSIASVLVTIQDPQAFIGRPVFTMPHPNMIKLIPEEREPGYFVLQCKATDKDGPDSALRYSFVTSRNPDHNKFRIDPVSGKLTTAEKLDREKQPQYNLQIKVTDSAKNISTVTLTVRLIDIDDHVPSFLKCNNDARDPLRGSIHENEKPPSLVLKVKACDADAAPNNEVFYKLTCGNEKKHFSIGLRSGEIHTTTSLDREKISKYTMCVTVYSADPDKPRTRRAAKPISSSSVGVVIDVLDRDDNGPTYARIPDKTLTTGLLINAPYNSLVIDAKAYDPDTPEHSITSYRILNMQFKSAGNSRSAPGAFQVDMTTGEIRTSIASYSDYTNGYFEIRIGAYDKRGRQAIVTVLIYVLNQSQRLKFIFSKPPNDVRPFHKEFMKAVGNVIGGRITIDLIRFSVGDAADFDFRKTDVCFHMVKDNDILQYSNAVTLLSLKNPALKKVYDQYGVDAIGLCNIGVKTYTRYTEASFWWVIIVLGLFLFVFVLILILVLICLWNRYRKFMLTNTSYIVKMGTNGELITNHKVLTSSAISESVLTTTAMAATDRTSKISYDEVDISLPTLDQSAGFEETTTTTVLTKTTDGGAYDNFGYESAESMALSATDVQSARYDNAAGISSTTTTKTEEITGGVVGGAVVTGIVTGGPVAGGSTTTVTKETKTLDASSDVHGSVVTDMRTVNAGGTPSVIRKIITTTTTVTEEVVEDPNEVADSSVVIKEVSGDVPQSSPQAIEMRSMSAQNAAYGFRSNKY